MKPQKINRLHKRSILSCVRNRTIATKLSLALGTLIAAMTVGFSSVIIAFVLIGRGAESITNQAMPGLIISSKLALSSDRVVLSGQKLMTAATIWERDKIADEIQIELTELDKLKEKLISFHISPQILEELDGSRKLLEHSIQELSASVDTVIKAEQSVNRYLRNLRGLSQRIQSVRNAVIREFAPTYEQYEQYLDSKQNLNFQKIGKWSASANQGVAEMTAVSFVHTEERLQRLKKQYDDQLQIMHRAKSEMPADMQKHIAALHSDFVFFGAGDSNIFSATQNLLKAKIALASANLVAQNAAAQYSLQTQNILELFKVEADQTSNYVYSLMRKVRMSLAICTLLAFTVFFVALWYLYRRLIKRIGDLRNIMMDRAGGGKIPITIAGNDELTDMADSVNELVQQLEDAKNQAERLSITDQLTGIANRFHLDNILIDEINRSNRYNTALAIILMDVDHFKSVNDQHGHLVGDLVLQDFSLIIQEGVRKTDYPGRWGGEEFLIICPATTGEGAAILAENLRRIVNSHKFPVVGKMTSSFGIAVFHNNDTVEDMIRKADEALYEAKEAGRDKVVLA